MLIRPPATGCGNETPCQAQADSIGARERIHRLMDAQGMTRAIQDRACLWVDPGSTAD